MISKVLITTLIMTVLSTPVALSSGLGLEEEYSSDFDTQNITYDEPISISGDFNSKKKIKRKKRVTAADRMRVMRRKLEKQNMMLVKKQIERIRLQSEAEMGKRLQRMFNQQMKQLNQI